MKVSIIVGGKFHAFNLAKSKFKWIFETNNNVLPKIQS